MIENWRDIESVPGYRVSDLGNVRGPHGPVKPHVTVADYLVVSLEGENGYSKDYLVHRLVAEAFLDLKASRKVIHRDGLHFNNVVENLIIVTASGRPVRRPRTMQIREVTSGQIFESELLAAKAFGLNPKEVHYSLLGQASRTGYKFEKVDI